ncbi:hypothetical protein ACFQLX_21760 [Streptomyces polyrhachis]|uniref:Uncharacterized protein n=1 Tax=Streptomyces polyrhachis TaxID=1282885 RepID=A0ABW2GJ43_9ACTN
MVAHPNGDYAITAMYSVPDDAWYLELTSSGINGPWMQLRPELVEVIHRLRQDYQGAVDDGDFPHVLAQVRAAVPAADVPAVLAAAFGPNPDGTGNGPGAL